MRQEDAETLALNAVAWLASDGDMLQHFCGTTGTTPSSLSWAVKEPEFLAGVLDFLTLDDAWVTGFAAAAGVSPEAVVKARAALPGGAAPNWT